MGYLIIVGVLALVTAVVAGIGRGLQHETGPNSTDSSRTGGKITKWSAVAVFALFFGVFTTVKMFHSVPAGHVGVTYAFGNVTGQTGAGLVTIAPWKNLREANVQVQRYNFKLTAFSQETQDVFVDATLNWHVSESNVIHLYRDIGPNYFEKIVPARVNQAFKDETVHFTATEIAPNREKIREDVIVSLRAKLKQFSIEVDDLNIDNLDFDPAFKNAIVDKQVATQEAQAAQNRVAKATAEAKSKVAEAEGDARANIARARGQAEANRLKRITLTPLLVQQNAIDKLNPNVQVILVPSNGNFLLPGSLFQGK